MIPRLSSPPSLTIAYLRDVAAAIRALTPKDSPTVKWRGDDTGVTANATPILPPFPQEPGGHFKPFLRDGKLAISDGMVEVDFSNNVSEPNEITKLLAGTTGGAGSIPYVTASDFPLHATLCTLVYLELVFTIDRSSLLNWALSSSLLTSEATKTTHLEAAYNIVQDTVIAADPNYTRKLRFPLASALPSGNLFWHQRSAINMKFSVIGTQTTTISVSGTNYNFTNGILRSTS